MKAKKTKIPKKRVGITVATENWERLQFLFKKAGKPYFMSKLIDEMVEKMLPVMEQANLDAENNRKMTNDEMQERYSELAKESFKDF